METIIELNTGVGQNTFTTKKIKGELHSVLIKADERTEIIIESELGYLLFHNREFMGMRYIALRQRSTAPIHNMMDIPSFEKFVLNEKLFITVIGQLNVDVSVILRFD